MALLRWSSSLDPARALLDLQREMDRFVQNPANFDLGVSSRGVFPTVNIFSDKDGYVVRLEVPGVSPEQITIESHGRTLKVSGKRAIATPEGGSFHRRERDAGEFSRSLQLPEDLDPARAEAAYKHGVLTIRVPKREEAKPRQITVKAA
jgi:HSP20 family protein